MTIRRRLTRMSLLVAELAIALLAGAVLLPVWLLPWKIAVRLGQMYGVTVGAVLPGARRVAMINLNRAYGKAVTRSAARAITWQACASLGQGLAEGIQMARRLDRATTIRDLPCDVEDSELVQRILTDPRPKIFATGHIGSWELAAILAGVFHRGHGAVIARRAQAGCFVTGYRVLVDEALTRRVVAGDVDLNSLRLADWLRLRTAGHVNSLAHLVQWTGAPGRLVRRFRWRDIRSANFGVWMRDLEAVNGFDETFQGWGHEDADLVLRLHNAGRIRKNGHLATEVFHLWHCEHSRTQEESNRHRVHRRTSGITRAEAGLQEAAAGPVPLVTDLAGGVARTR